MDVSESVSARDCECECEYKCKCECVVRGCVGASATV